MGCHPYLDYGTNCREPFTHYHEIFGGERVLLAMADMPAPSSDPAPESDREGRTGRAWREAPWSPATRATRQGHGRLSVQTRQRLPC